MRLRKNRDYTDIHIQIGQVLKWAWKRQRTWKTNRHFCTLLLECRAVAFETSPLPIIKSFWYKIPVLGNALVLTSRRHSSIPSVYLVSGLGLWRLFNDEIANTFLNYIIHISISSEGCYTPHRMLPVPRTSSMLMNWWWLISLVWVYGYTPRQNPFRTKFDIILILHIKY